MSKDTASGPVCPLCLSPGCTQCGASLSRPFFLCDSCSLIFVPAQYHLTSQQEKERYALHHNNADNREYRTYLSTIADEVLRLASGPTLRAICDFGSGREHVLADIFVSRGHRCEAHDPLYGLVAEGEGRFDIVVACETVEHLRNPRRDLDLIRRLVAPKGHVYIRTQLYERTRAGDISAWWYALDPTHISFFCDKTMETVAEILEKKIIFTNGKDTVVFGA